jgi:hypothetical protein
MPRVTSRRRAWSAVPAVVALLVATAGAQKPTSPAVPVAPPEFASVDALVKSLPSVSAPTLDDPRAQWLVAQPFACLDELQPRPTNRPYFWDATFRPVDGYDKVRAFYGCGDWHSAVNATWTIATVLKRMPDISVSRLIREKLADHLGKSNLDGEVAYFKDAGAFERPYGYVWLLTLGAELQTWNDQQAAQWAANVAPLSKYLSEQLVAYLKDLDRPVRTGGQTNTALVLSLAFDASETLNDFALRGNVIEYATKWYAKDTDACPLDAEVAPGDLVNPCLSEAALMSRVLDRATFATWLTHFLYSPTSPKFMPLLSVSMTPPGRQGGGGANRGAAPPAAGAPAGAAGEAQAGRGRGTGQGSGRATPITLALTRAEAFNRLASALPETDERVRVYRSLAALNADAGIRALIDPATIEAPWLGGYALRVLAPAQTR